MSKGIFITGTTTEIGKTFVSALVVKKLRDAGIDSGYYKAAASGNERDASGAIIAGDAKHVCDISGLPEKPENLVSYLYEIAVSPHLAAQIENLPIEMGKVAADYENLARKFDFMVVEGAGGIVCPLRLDKQKIMQIDVIKKLGYEILIVAPAALGTINATVLTVEYARSQGIGIKGVIMNNFEAGNFLHEDNKVQIEALAGIPVIATVAPDATDFDAAKLIGLLTLPA
ncbi:MAG: dethiobiotin synthase [Alphaproteobacteria bacterium]|nr:dethiobiotin synthase [Alphaproteobacteria bacterium]